MNLQNLLTLRFYEEPAASGGGEGSEPTGAPMKKEPAVHQDPSRLRTKPTNVKDFLSKSTVVKTQGQTATGENVTIVPNDPNQATPEPGTQPEPGKGTTNEPGEILVTGPGQQTQQPKSEPEPGKPEGPTGEGVPQTGTVKIGDVEYTVEQVQAGQEALTKAEESEEQRKTWQGNLTKKSQIVSAMADDLVQEVLPYATSQRKLPENIKEELAKIEEYPETFTVTDSQGFENEYKTEDLPEEFLNNIANAVLMKKWPEFAEAIQDRERLKSENEKITQSVTQEQYGRGVEMSIELMTENPDVAITLRKGDDLKTVMAGIIRAGDTHPEYENAVRFGTLLKAVSEGLMPDLKTAHSIMVGGNTGKANAAAQVTKNQNTALPTEKPTGTTPGKPDAGREFLNKKRNVKGQKVMNLGR